METGVASDAVAVCGIADPSFFFSFLLDLDDRFKLFSNGK
jgi:hypothetical protein